MVKSHFLVLTLIFLLYQSEEIQSAAPWDIAPFGVCTVWTSESDLQGQRIEPRNELRARLLSEKIWNIGVVWQEQRDIQQIELVPQTSVAIEDARNIEVQYWFCSWPDQPPHLPSVEDQADDPWQGEWLTAKTRFTQNSDTLLFSFQPITLKENRNAGFLPSVDYRRTLKIRLLFPFAPPVIKSLHCFSPGTEKQLSLRLQFGCTRSATEQLESSLSAFNGKIIKLTPWRWGSADHFILNNSFTIAADSKPKGILVDLIAADPSLPGSTDHTIVTVRQAGGAFSFSCRDVQKNPIYVPAYDTYITLAADTSVYRQSNVRKGRTVREKIKLEQEQSYERSRAEIPALNPVKRDIKGIGDRLYLPLSADSHWQKFGLEWGGNFFMNKRYVRAKAKELARCLWPGETLRWEIGAGEKPIFDRDTSSCQMSILNNYLPVVTSRWVSDGLNLTEEAFATLLDSPLSPRDPGRDEQKPAILMIRLRVSNSLTRPNKADIWLKGEPLSNLSLENGCLLQEQMGLKYIRLFLRKPQDATAHLVGYPVGHPTDNSVHLSILLPANESRDIYLAVPFVSDIDQKETGLFAALEYETEKRRVVDYWRDLVNQRTIYNVPEAKFNEMARAVVPHLYMSVFKDPGSGLYMLPAAALRYQIYANESCFQMQLLDLLGDHKSVTDYLNTFIQLQGSKPLPGSFSGSQKAVYFGAKINDEYDYTATGYNLHHGTVLWTMARHYLMTRDQGWLDGSAASMLAAADWIIEQRGHTKIMLNKQPDFCYGLLPAGRLEDNQEWDYWFSVNAYACLGLETMAKAFRLAGKKEAERLGHEAAAYRRDLRDAVVRATEKCPVVALRNGISVPFVPSTAGQRFRSFDLKSDYYRRYDETIKPMLRLSATREILYGPMILLNTGLIDAEEPMADWILDDWEENLTLSSSLGLSVHGWVDDEKWFSRGGMVFQANLQNPIQAYLLRREVPAALRSLYNNMVSCLYPDVNAFTEEYRTWIHGSGPFYKTPDEARFVQRVCDLLIMENKNQLWLASGTPRRWLEPGNRIELKKAATIYGLVSFSMQPGIKLNTISAQIQTLFRETPEQVRLYVRSPFSGAMTRVSINGKEWKQWDAGQEVVYLSQSAKNQNVEIEYR